MSEKIDALLNKQVGSESIFYIIGLSLLALVLIFAVIVIIRLAYHVERLKGEPAFNLIKSIVIAIIPGIYYGLLALNIDVPVKQGIVIAVTAAIVLIIAILNFKTFGATGCFVLTFVQCFYATLLVLCVMSIAFIMLAAIAGFIAFVAGGNAGSSYSSSVPGILRDPGTNETFYTNKGANGHPYVNRYGTDLPLHMTSYGRWMDSNGNEYV